MALPKKGTRRIHVDGGDYRWAVSPDSGYMVVVIEGASASRRRLFVVTDYRDLLTPSADGAGFEMNQQRQITPAYVRRCILAGLAAGWDPLKPGSDFELRDEPDGEIRPRLK